MESKNLLIQDTNGELAADNLKLDGTKESTVAFFDITKKNNVSKKLVTLNVLPGNVNFTALPSAENLTYAAILTYNGTAGYKNKIFSTIVASDTGIFDFTKVPVLKYNPQGDVGDGTYLYEKFDDIVIDIKMYNGTVDVLNYADSRMGEGPLTKGSRGYIVKSRRSFPTKIHKLPQVEGKNVHLDGWYSYTFILYRDVNVGTKLYRDMIYAYKGKLFSVDREYIVSFIDSDNDVIRVMPNLGEGGLGVANDLFDGVTSSIDIIKSADYEKMLFDLNENSDLSPQSNSIFLHSQLLVTEELSNAIVSEVMDIACNGKIGCDFLQWQRLNTKKVAAEVMFQNGMFEKAQIILESVRAACNCGGFGGFDKKFDFNC